jgi:transcription initiation factor IIF auxiliary subunit
MTVRFDNYSMLTGEKYGDNFYDWCIFVDEDSTIINSIKSVEYTLHPTFPDPVRVIEDKSSRFALYGAGWGMFVIKIRITYEDGSTSLTSYLLQLKKDNWPKKPAPQDFVDNETKLVYQALFHPKYRWRQVGTVTRQTKFPKDKVLHILDKLQKEDLVRKASWLSIDGKELWAPTAVVGLAPRIDKT